MLRAPTSSPDRAPNQRPDIAVATLRDVPRIAAGHTAARAARRSRAVRWLIWPAVLATVLQLIGQVGRGEVFSTSHGSSVVMTPTTARRTPAGATLVATLIYLLFVIVIPLAITVAAAMIGGAEGAVGVLVASAYLFAIVAAPLMAAGRRGRHVAAHRSTGDWLGFDGVRLHDLVRHRRDPAGTGVALLHEVICDPRFIDSTIITTAASSQLADAYQAAGMTPLPGTTTLVRRPQVQLADGRA